MNLCKTGLLIGCVAAALVSGAAGTANAQSYAGRPGAHVSGVDIELHLALGYGFNRGPGDYGNGYGFGARLGIPLMSNGPIRSINNSLVLGVGADFAYWSGHRQHDTVWVTSEVIFPIMLQWNFYLASWFSVFPEAGIALGLGGCDGCAFYAAPGFAVGARIHFDGRAGYPALVLRVGFPVGVTLGIAF